MPEGPEVRVITDQLQRYLGQEVIYISGVGGRYKDLSKIELNQKILNIGCKGKFIYWKLEKDIIFNTLGMSGSWGVKNKHSCILVKTNSDEVYFNDIRHFGTLTIGTAEDLSKKLSGLHGDLLSGEVPGWPLLTVSKRTLPEILMDQGIFAGVGNYIKAEGLYRAGISPHRFGKDLSEDEWKKLIGEIAKVMRESYNAGGASFRTYESMVGPGSFEFKVYGRKKDQFGNLVKKEMTRDKRATWWVPEIQK